MADSLQETHSGILLLGVLLQLILILLLSQDVIEIYLAALRGDHQILQDRVLWRKNNFDKDYLVGVKL